MVHRVLEWDYGWPPLKLLQVSHTVSTCTSTVFCPHTRSVIRRYFFPVTKVKLSTSKFISQNKAYQYCHWSKWTWHGKFAWLNYQLQYDVAHTETAHYLVSCVLSVFCKACGHSWHNRSKFMACARQQVRPPIWLTSLAFLRKDVALDLWWDIQGKPLCLTLDLFCLGLVWVYCLVFVASFVGQEHNYNWVGELCIIFALFNNWTAENCLTNGFECEA